MTTSPQLFDTPARRAAFESVAADVQLVRFGGDCYAYCMVASGFVDVVIEASGSPAAVSQALDLVRDGGRVVICGHYTDNGPVEIHPHWQVNRKHVEIRGCWGCDYSHFHRAVGIAARFGDRVPWREMIGGRYGLEQAGEALAAVENRTVTKAVITPNGGT